MTSLALPIDIAGETLWMHSDRALLWPSRNAVIVADTHFAKSQIFCRNGIGVPSGTDAHDRQRLELLLRDSSATRLFILGDFLHAALSADDPEIQALESWVAQLHGVSVCVIAGNHDRHALRYWTPSFEWRSNSISLGPLTLVHELSDAVKNSSSSGIISGHVHPVWRPPGRHRGGLRVPVFWKHAQGMILPSFGSLTGGFAARPRPGDELFAIAQDTVIAVPRYAAPQNRMR